ncbi:MAG: putative membrane protein [Oceanicoccus sp.]|jgi:uncharacterized membrane protein
MLQSLPAQLQVLILSMLPILELRFAIPYGMAALEMSRWTALAFALIGNTAITVFLIWALDPVTKFLSKHVPGMKRFIDWLFHKTRKKHDKKMGELGHLALFLFVAIPLPGSGAWSGSLIAYLFNVKKKPALFWIFLGLIVSGLIVAFGTAGIMKAIESVLAG